MEYWKQKFCKTEPTARFTDNKWAHAVVEWYPKGQETTPWKAAMTMEQWNCQVIQANMKKDTIKNEMETFSVKQ